MTRVVAVFHLVNVTCELFEKPIPRLRVRHPRPELKKPPPQKSREISTDSHIDTVRFLSPRLKFLGYPSDKVGMVVIACYGIATFALGIAFVEFKRNRS